MSYVYDFETHKNLSHKQSVLFYGPPLYCFQGIAFALTIQDAIGAGISILIAMIIKLIPQKLGDAVILSKAGLNHFWENVLSLLAVCSVYIGAIVGMALRSQLSSAQPYFFGALSGIFLYISLSSLFPVLHDIIDDNEIISMSSRTFFRRIGFFGALTSILVYNCK